MTPCFPAQPIPFEDEIRKQNKTGGPGREKRCGVEAGSFFNPEMAVPSGRGDEGQLSSTGVTMGGGGGTAYGDHKQGGHLTILFI